MAKEKQKPKKTKGPSFKATVLFIITGLILFFLTPFPGFITSLIPKDVIRTLISDYYQDTLLDNSGAALSDPVKYNANAPYPILGRESGVCMKFHSTITNENADNIDANRIQNAQYGTPIAEIIVAGERKKQYALKEVTFSEGSETTKNNEIVYFSVICQKIGKGSTTIPKTIKAIYIRPLKQFRPTEIIWATQKDW
jgi:hypothetical protein